MPPLNHTTSKRAKYVPLSERRSQPSGNLSAIMQGIAHVESGGDYGAIGKPNSKGQRAYGKYQVFETNIPSWTREALGRELSPNDFLADHDAQERVARHFMSKSFDRYGNPDDVASVWFTGRPVSEAGLDVSDYTGTSNAAYLQRFRDGMGMASSKPSYTPLAERRSGSRMLNFT